MLSLLSDQRAIAGERVTLLSLDEGAVVTSTGAVTKVEDASLHYSAPTSPGSSGAPVFNEHWQLLAMHHSVLPSRREEVGRLKRGTQVIAIAAALRSLDRPLHPLIEKALEPARSDDAEGPDLPSGVERTVLSLAVDGPFDPTMRGAIRGDIDRVVEDARHADVGVRIRYVGDDLLCFFQSPDVACGFAVQAHSALTNRVIRGASGAGAWAVRIGMATGGVEFDEVESARWGASGRAVVRAVQMEHMARPGEMLCDAATFASLSQSRRPQFVGPVHSTSVRNGTFETYRCSLESIPPTGGPTSPTLWVVVAGTGSHLLPAGVLDAAERVGEWLVNNHYGLITGGWPGVDHVVARSASKAARAAGRDPAGWITHVVKAGEPPDFKEGRVIPVADAFATFEARARLAAGVILIGGLGGARAAAWHAIQARKPVFPLAATGGEALAVFDDVRANWSEFSWMPTSLDVFLRLQEEVLALHVIKDALDRFASATHPPTGRPRALIVGSFKRPAPPEEFERFARCCQQLGKALTDAEFTILVGSFSPDTADYYVLQGCGQAARRANVLVLKPNEFVASRVIDDLLSRASFDIKTLDGSWHDIRRRQVDAADVVVAIGVSSGTKAVIDAAVELGKPLLPLPTFPGSASEAWPFVSSDLIKRAPAKDVLV